MRDLVFPLCKRRRGFIPDAVFVVVQILQEAEPDVDFLTSRMRLSERRSLGATYCYPGISLHVQ